MQKITVSQFKRALAAREKLAAGAVAGQSTGAQVDAIRGSSTPQETFRLAVQSRYEAAKYLAAGGGLFSRSVVLVDEPFLIWASPHSNIIQDSSIERSLSWAKIKIDDSGPDHDSILDSLTFYYLWENATAYYTVVDVSSFMTVSGVWQARASIYGKHSPGNPNDPDYDPAATIALGGSAHLGLSANLALYQWWNSPPTLAPLQNAPDQQTQIGFLNVDLHAVPPDPLFKSAFMFKFFELKQTLLVIPPEGVLVAEVSFDVDHEVNHGHVIADFSSGDGNQVTSHWLHIAYVIAPPLTTTPVESPGTMHP
jgi:hypothetical protein